VATGAGLFRQSIPPIGPAVTPHHRVTWIRDQHRLYARELAVDYVLDPEGGIGGHGEYKDAEEAEAFSAAVGFGLQCHASVTEIITAARAEWVAAVNLVHNCLDHVRRRISPMCRAQMPEQTIIAAAQSVCSDHGVYIDRELLMPVLLKVWNAAQIRSRRVPVTQEHRSIV
jgi:hypothetical protein